MDWEKYDGLKSKTKNRKALICFFFLTDKFKISCYYRNLKMILCCPFMTRIVFM